jgi:hypothetical protein
MQFTVDTDLAIVGIVIGLIAVVIAVPPLLQMLYGRPRLEFSFDEFTGPNDDGKQLLIAIKNKRTESRLLRKIGVERTVGNVLAYFDIQEQGTNRFIKKDISGLLHCAPTRESGLLGRALPAFTLGISIVHTRGTVTCIIDPKSEPLESIGTGDYTVFATIICGEQVHKIRKNFKVGKAPHLTFWV